MGKKLYYNDHRIASLMQEWHGVRIQSVLSSHDMTIQKGGGENPIDDPLIYDDAKKFYIHKDSYSIFEPRNWDLVSIDRSPKANSPNAVPYIFRENQPDYDDLKRIIILRDNKHFFVPEEEVEAKEQPTKREIGD